MELRTVIRPPTPDEAGSWYRAYPIPPGLELARRFLEQREPDRGPPPLVVSDADEPAVPLLVLTACDGRRVLLQFRDGEVRLGALRGQPPAERAAPDATGRPVTDAAARPVTDAAARPGADAGDGPLEDAVLPAIELLQRITGWYVFGWLAPEFEPVGACQACLAERFSWQDTCISCGELLADEEPARAEEATEDRSSVDLDAEALVGLLLDEGLLELASVASRPRVEACVARCCGSPQLILGRLIELPGVAEVYADEVAIARALQQVKERGRG